MTQPRTLPYREFAKLPLRKTWRALDKATGLVYRHELRRCPSTGLTLEGRWPVTRTLKEHYRHV